MNKHFHLFIQRFAFVLWSPTRCEMTIHQREVKAADSQGKPRVSWDEVMLITTICKFVSAEVYRPGPGPSNSSWSCFVYRQATHPPGQTVQAGKAALHLQTCSYSADCLSVTLCPGVSALQAVSSLSSGCMEAPGLLSSRCTSSSRGSRSLAPGLPALDNSGHRHRGTPASSKGSFQQGNQIMEVLFLSIFLMYI